jgi:hypothetical protein
VLQVLDLLAEAVGQPRESAHPHPHGEVLALGIARGDVIRVGVAPAHFRSRAKALRRAVAGLAFRDVAVNLDELREVDVLTEAGVNRRQVGVVPSS